jgi:Ca-activated chloride channel family protein
MVVPHWGDFSFAHPWWLFGLLLLPLLSLLQGGVGGAGLLFSSTTLVAKIGHPHRSAAGAILLTLFYGAMASLLIALARPQWSKTTDHIQASGIDIMIVLDVSGSMATEDYVISGEHASRLEAVKQVTQQFIEGRPNDRIGIVAFAGRPYLVSPITLDHDWLIKNLDRIQLGLVEDGTAIGSALASAASRLKNREAKSKLILLLTDGANNAGKVMPLTAAEAAKALGIRIYTIGAGSNGPVTVPMRDAFGRVVMQKVTFDFDEKLLQEIAKIGDGKYFRAADAASLQRTFGEIDRLEKSSITLDKKTDVKECFWWFLLLALLLLTVEMVASQTRWSKIP